MLPIGAGNWDELVVINRLLQSSHLTCGRFLGIPVSGVDPAESDEGQGLIEEIDSDVVPGFFLLEGRSVPGFWP